MTTAQIEAQINKNYDAAAVFYDQRKEIFLKQWSKQYSTSFEQVYNNFFSEFLLEFNKWSNKILEQFQRKEKIDTKGVTAFTFKGQKIMTGLTADQLIGKTSAAQKRQMAFPFEKTIQQFFNKIAHPTKNAISDFVAVHTGGIVQEGFTFAKGAKMIRSDIAFSNLPGKGAKKIPEGMELSVDLDNNLQSIFTSFTMSPAQQQAVLMRQLQAGYLSEDKFVGGFSIKNYSKNIAYTHSKVLLDEVNESLRNIYEKMPKQSDVQMRYVLSKHVIAITSPTVLGLITNKGLKWISEILRQNEYIMHLRFNKDYNQFYVGNSAIYFAEKNRNRIKYSTWEHGKLSSIMEFTYTPEANLEVHSFQ